MKIKLTDSFIKVRLASVTEKRFSTTVTTIEVFILDFDGDLYNKDLDMIFVDYLRPQIKYDNWDLLKEQIEKDVVAVRNAVHL